MIFVNVSFQELIYCGPSIYADNTWKPVKDYTREHIKPNDREKYYFDEYDPSELQAAITTQQKVIDDQKEKNIKIYTGY